MTHSLIDDLATILSGKLGRKVGVHRYCVGRGWRYSLIFETNLPGTPAVFRDMNIDQAKGRLNTLIDLIHFGVITNGPIPQNAGSEQDAQGGSTRQHQRADFYDPSPGGDGGASTVPPEPRFGSEFGSPGELARHIVSQRFAGVPEETMRNDAPTKRCFDTAVACVEDVLRWTDAQGSPGPIDDAPQVVVHKDKADTPA